MMDEQKYVVPDTGRMDIQINEESNNNITKDKKDTPTLRLVPVDTLKIETDKPFVEEDLDSWVIVKVAKDDIDKKKRNETTRARLQTKIPVLKTIRGPFRCSHVSSSDATKQCNRVFYNRHMYLLHCWEEHMKRRKVALRCQVGEKRLDKHFSGTTLQGPTLNIRDYSPFLCRPCGIIFSDETQYDEHNRIVHVKVKPYQCPICAKRFAQQGGLQQHVRAHLGLKPFACTFCSEAFTQKADLDRHLCTHIKVKSFKRVICSKCFSLSVQLRQHMRTHTKVQLFECHICGRKFKENDHLNIHIRSHSRYLSEHRPTQSNQNSSGLSGVLGLKLQQVEHGGAVYYSAKLPSSLFANGRNTTSSNLPFTAEEAPLDRNSL